MGGKRPFVTFAGDCYSKGKSGAVETRYPVWNKNISIEYATLLRSRLIIDNDKSGSLLINKSAESIFRVFDGKKTYENCIASLSEKYNDEKSKVEKLVSDYLGILKNQYGLELIYSDRAEEHQCRILGEIRILPHVASIEVTDFCNIRCKHCYGDFSSEKRDRMPVDKLCRLLDSLQATGIETIELTGGELTTHPQIEEIISYACQCSFSKINILTNGVLIKEELLDILEKNKDKVFIQIDLHTLSDEYLQWFTQTNIQVAIIQNNINKIRERSIPFRLVSIITHKNCREIPAIADYAHTLGVSWTPSIVEPVGRACDQGNGNELYLSLDDWKEYVNGMKYCQSKYPGMISVRPKEATANDYNCGVLTEHVVINCHGNIKLCTMDDGTLLGDRLGNCFEKDIRNSVLHLNCFRSNHDYIGDCIAAIKFWKNKEFGEQYLQLWKKNCS